MPNWSSEQDIAGRAVFSSWRFHQNYAVPWDWADMSTWERQQWVEHA